MTESFNFDTEIEPVSWIVDKLIPAEQLVIVLAQAGVGKSLLVENLAVCITHAIPFCGLNTVEGDVLIIDQDTPENVLKSRLIRFAKALNTTPKHELFIESMKGYTISDRTIAPVIKNYPTVKLIIIDSLHSICGKSNPNYTTDMNRLAKLKEECITDYKTILINHHISQKWELTIDDLMKGEPNKFSMGSSSVIQQADSYYVIGAKAENGSTNRMYMRAISKRVSIPMPPIVMRIYNNEQGEVIEYDGIYEPDLDEAQYDIMMLFEQEGKDRTVKEVYEAMGHKHGEIKVRNALTKLDISGKLLVSHHRHNMFKYRRP